jgi:hypothetical protein
MSMSNTTKRVKEIRRKTRRKFSSEEKIRVFAIVHLLFLEVCLDDAVYHSSHGAFLFLDDSLQ